MTDQPLFTPRCQAKAHLVRPRKSKTLMMHVLVPIVVQHSRDPGNHLFYPMYTLCGRLRAGWQTYLPSGEGVTAALIGCEKCRREWVLRGGGSVPTTNTMPDVIEVKPPKSSGSSSGPKLGRNNIRVPPKLDHRSDSSGRALGLSKRQLDALVRTLQKALDQATGRR